jgi:LysM repeat protein
MIHELIIAGAAFFHPQADSTGIETINGKIFIIHQVGEKETLYGISKRYGTTVDDVLKYNPTADGGLEIGQILKIPYTPRSKSSAPQGGIIHVVAVKETMFSIAKAYNISVDELKQWNNLSDNSLAIGQELTIKKRNTVTDTNTPKEVNNVTTSQSGVHTVGAKETMFSITQKYGITVLQLKEWNHLDGNELSIGQKLIVVQPRQTVVTVPKEIEPVKNTPIPEVQPVKETPPTTIRISESVKNADELIENGIAELIEGTDGNRKYLALHRTAPVGTILKVKNEMNNREVFVRVMGKLPDTALTEKVITRISKSAYDRLGAIDPRFRVEVTYYK